MQSHLPGPTQYLSEWREGAKNGCVSQIGVGGGGLCLKILILIPLNDGKCIY